MKFSWLHKTLSVTLSVLVLVSTFSFTVEQHFCGDTLVDTAVFSSAKKCGMESYTSDKETYTKKPCCKDTVDVIEGQDELSTVTFDDLELSQKIVITSYLFSFSTLFKSLPKEIIPHKDYSPPNIVKDIYILDETYLI